MRSARSTCGEKVRQPSPATLNPVDVESNLVLRPRPPSPFLGCMIPHFPSILMAIIITV